MSTIIKDPPKTPSSKEAQQELAKQAVKHVKTRQNVVADKMAVEAARRTSDWEQTDIIRIGANTSAIIRVTVSKPPQRVMTTLRCSDNEGGLAHYVIGTANSDDPCFSVLIENSLPTERETSIDYLVQYR